METKAKNSCINPALQQAVKFFGSQKKMAEELKVSETALSFWCRNISPVPPKRCVQIEKLTGILRHEFREDGMDFWG